MSTGNARAKQLRQPDDFRKVFALATESALLLITAVVISRRLGGTFAGPAAPAVPCTVATFAGALSLAALGLWRTASASTGSPKNLIIVGLLTVVPPVALGAALWIGPSAFVGGYLVALAAACALGAVAIEDHASDSLLTDGLRSALFQREAPSQPKPQAVAVKPPTDTSIAAPVTDSVASAVIAKETPDADLTADDELEEMAEDEAQTDPSLVQSMTRRRLSDGGEMVEGSVRIELGASDKVGVAHLAFSPPLPHDPEAECHLISDFDGRVRITTSKAYGLRIEARLSGEPTAAAVIDVAFSAVAQSVANRAAAAA
jgi:hypothetical protein